MSNKFWPILSAERIDAARNLLLPGSAPLGRQLLQTLETSIRHSFYGPFLVFGALLYLSFGQRSALWALGIGICYLMLSFLNHRRIQRCAYSEPGPEQVRLVFVQNLLTFLALALLMAAIPWQVGSTLSAYSELTVTIILIGFTLLLAFMHSAFPWAVLVFATVVCGSVVAYWLQTAYDFKYALAVLTAVFYVLLIRSSFNFARILRQSLRLQIERDEARAKAVKSAMELEAALHSLRQVNAEKLRMFAAANHDIRQPMSAISLFIGVLDRKLKRKLGKSDPEINDLLDKVDRNIQTLDVIVSALSEVTSIESGASEPRPERFKLLDLAEDVVSEFSRHSESSSTVIQVALGDEILWADRAMMARILRNVLDNALKYAAGKPILITLVQRGTGRGSQLPPSLWLSVRDHGPGIPLALRDAVFQEYTQIANPERDRKKGYGLGLAIVKKLADAMRCEIALRAPPDGGLEFLIDVSLLVEVRPQAAPSSADRALDAPYPAQAALPAQEAQVTPVNVAKGSVLVVDDDDDVRLALRTLLEAWGCQVNDFGNFGDTWEHLRKLDRRDLPRQVLLDNWLPDSRGLDCVQMIRGLSPGAQITLITGDADAATAARANQLGVQVLLKPVTPKKLAELVLAET